MLPTNSLPKVKRFLKLIRNIFSYSNKFAGAIVVAVSRTQEKLAELRKALPAGTNTAHLIDVVGDFSSEAHGNQTRDKVNAALKVIL